VFIKKLNKRKLNPRFCLGIHRFFTIYIFCHIFFGQDRRELPRAALNLAKQLYTIWWIHGCLSNLFYRVQTQKFTTFYIRNSFQKFSRAWERRLQ